MVTYQLFPVKSINDKIRITYNNYQRLSENIGEKEVTLSELEQLIKSLSLTHLNKYHLIAIMRSEHRDTLTYIDGFSYESERNNNYIRLYGIGRILIDIEPNPKKRIKPDFVKIIYKKKKWYAELP